MQVRSRCVTPYVNFSHVANLSFHLRGEFLTHAPDNKEGVSNISVRCTVPLVHNAVNNLSYLINEDHDLVLQDLRRVSEVADIAEAAVN